MKNINHEINNSTMQKVETNGLLSFGKISKWEVIGRLEITFRDLFAVLIRDRAEIN